MKTLILLCVPFFLWGLPATQPSKRATADGGYVLFFNTPCSSTNGRGCDMILEKYSKTEVLEWAKAYGGNSWDYIADVLVSSTGYYVLGNTSSFGQGNLDVYLIKTDSEGEELWAKTYGGFFNEYGRKLSTSKHLENSVIIEGERQICPTENVSDQCSYIPFIFRVNAMGEAATDCFPEAFVNS